MASAAGLIERATQVCGIDCFGDPGFREGLDRLVHALDREARLTQAGAGAMDAFIVDILVKRLQVEACIASEPAIDEQEIVAPLVGIGLPRTASTALACMLGEDSRYRSLRNWEAMAPCPPPDPADGRVDPRLARAEAAMERRAIMTPRMTAMLPSSATSPTECQLFMAYDFKSQIFQSMVRIPSYVQWLLHEADLVGTYACVKRVLKLLQYRTPQKSWRLKNPSHSLFIEAFDKVFPDARFVMTHRPVSRVLPSVADLYFELHGAYSDTIDTLAIGAEATEFCDLAMRRMIAFRDGGNDERFFDVHFDEFQADPLAVIARLYAWLGQDLSDEARTAMRQWRETSPRDEGGYERTPPAVFGLDADAIERRFAFYNERFGLQAVH